jgi:trehalose 6-phosphate synthase/phosphatase
MDSFSEPKLTDQASLEDVRQQVSQLQESYRAKGLPLSGRVLHVCHQLPIRATLHNTVAGSSSNLGVPSPPSTPPQSPGGLKTPSLTTTAGTTQDGSGKPRWTLAPRYGHAAMIAGIRSLSATHEQLIVGWTGDIESPLPNEKITAVNVSNEDREAYTHALETYATREDEELQQSDNGKGSTGYVPVWMDDKVAHGHYDGYCKQSKIVFHNFSMSFPLWGVFSIFATASPFYTPALALRTHSGLLDCPRFRFVLEL